MKNIIRKILKIITALILSITLLFVISIINFTVHLDKIEANGDSGYHSSYYIYTSKKTILDAEKGKKINILVVPNNTAMTSDNIRKHEDFALLQTYISHIIFKDLNSVILVPIFPRPEKNKLIYTQALDRDTLTTEIEELKRLDLQLNMMIDKTHMTLSEHCLTLHPKQSF